MKDQIEIFFSYAHEDEDLMNDVRRQLIVEERNGHIIKWHDREIPPGTDWRQEIDNRLERADIILLFMSPHFIESKYCYEVEGKAALRRHKSGEARVIPIILRPCLWDRSPFGKLQALPRDAKPVSQWSDRDEACLEVAKGVMLVVDELLASQGSARSRRDYYRAASIQQRPYLPTFSEPRYEKIERLMPELLEEMREDLVKYPTKREFVVLKRGWVYNSQDPYLAYYLDDHDDLEGKLQILQNLGLVHEITYNNVRRFVFEEPFVDYLTRTEGGSNIIATSIDHLEVHNSLSSDNFYTKTSNLTGKQKSALASLVHLGDVWREDFYVVWHEPIGISDILEFDGNPPQVSKGDIRALEREGLIICEFLSNDKAHITLIGKSYDAISVFSEEVDLTIIPQVKEMDSNLYVIINVVNNENRTAFLRAEIRGIFDNSDQNIKREISQYANLFSWSGGSQNGTKEIPSGLDGTINLVVRRPGAYGFFFLFQENPDTNWRIQGIYKLDIVIRGTIGELEFAGKKVTISFEYIEKEERDRIGGFFNRGVLKLLNWNIEKNTYIER